MNPRALAPLVAVTGAVVLAAGWLVARTALPEWQGGDLPTRAELEARFEAVADRAGLELAGGSRHLLDTVGRSTLNTAYSSVDAEAPRLLVADGRGLALTVSRAASWEGGPAGRAAVSFSTFGQPIAASWAAEQAADFFGEPDAASDPQAIDAQLARELLREGETLGPETLASAFNNDIRLAPIEGTELPQVMVHRRPPGSSTVHTRVVGGVGDARREQERIDFAGLVKMSARPLLLLLAAAILFVVLLSRRRIDVRHGLVLGVAALATAAPATVLGATETVEIFFVLPTVVLASLVVFFSWSAAESLLRATRPGFSTSLDALGRLRLGPRGGRGLLLGWGAGTAIAGALLAVAALVGRWPALAAREATAGLPAFGLGHNPLIHGPLRAAVVVLALAAAERWLPRWWRVPAAALVASLFFEPLVLVPWWGQRLVALAVAAVLVWVVRRWGLTALLAAAVVATLAPPALLAAQHPGWLGGTLAVAGGLLVALPLVGAVGLARPAEVERGSFAGPAFLRRVEEERRLRYEMDLLARIQIGLLPADLPTLPGYRFAARSTLATEVGGDLYDFYRDEAGNLWLAAGDVSGHGYSCAIAHAMVKSALMSLIQAERTPGEILGRIDNVLRSGGSARQFTSLALLKLDPETGRGQFANAGHPYPLLLLGRDTEEVAAPGLPLGQGPERVYTDRPVDLPAGGALLFFSDGLVEAVTPGGDVYGFQRPGRVAREATDRAGADADAILDSVLADWRHWVGSGQVADDTTVVVICREGG